MRKFSILVLMLSALLLVPDADAGVSENLGIGFNIGGQRIYGDRYVRSAVDFGGEGLINYSIRKNRFGIVPSLGYSWLKSYYEPNDEVSDTSSTNLVTLDVKGVFWLLPQQIVNPYLFVGLGIINFSFPTNSDHRYFDGSFILGGGVEWMINPKLGLNATLDYRYTTGDDFDGRSGGTTDGYLNGRVGLNFYFEEKGAITNNDMFAIDAQANEQLMENLDSNEVQNQGKYSMDELLVLKTHVDDLNEKIAEKESEILEVKTLIESRKDKVVKLEHQGPVKPPPSNSGSMRNMAASSIEYTPGSSEFTSSYEHGLERFYAKDYDSAISIMNELVRREPGNRLISNCLYWIGEAQFGKREYQAAAASFEKVQDYPNSPKLDDALIMAGRCHLKLGDVDRATKAFNQLLANFPDSEYVEKAEKYLSEF
jgi:TolA-binding protein